MSEDNNIHVLIIEDDESVRVTTEALLEDEGFTVASVDNITDAVATVQQCKYDAVIMDWHLGQHCGSEIVDPMRSLQPNLRIIVSTGDPSSIEDTHCTIDAVVRKGDPFSQQLRHTLDSLLNR